MVAKPFQDDHRSFECGFEPETEMLWQMVEEFVLAGVGPRTKKTETGQKMTNGIKKIWVRKCEVEGGRGRGRGKPRKGGVPKGGGGQNIGGFTGQLEGENKHI